MKKTIKGILIAVAVIAGIVVILPVAFTIKNHFDSLKPHLADDYYTEFKSDYELEKICRSGQL